MIVDVVVEVVAVVVTVGAAKAVVKLVVISGSKTILRFVRELNHQNWSYFSISINKQLKLTNYIITYHCGTKAS